MTKNDDLDNGGCSTDPTVMPKGGELSHSRRHYLRNITICGLTVLAGCGQNTSNTPTETQGRIAQTLRAPTGNDPVKTTFFSRNTWGHLLGDAFATVAKENAGSNLQRLVWEPGVWADGGFVGTGKVHYNWIKDPIEITPTQVTITIRDDAKWSDGHRITPKDIACIPLQESIRKHFPAYYADVGPNEPVNIHAAFDDFELTDHSITYKSSAGHFKKFWDIDIKNILGTYVGPRHVPTHIVPYSKYGDVLLQTVKRAQAGEVNPWEGYNKPRQQTDDPHKASLVEKYLNKTKYVNKFSDPENVLATGAWDLDELRGKEFIFTPNKHHPVAEGINFDTLSFEFTPSSKRQRAALKADRFDFGSTAYGPPTPQSVVESFPDSIRQILVPGNQITGNELALYIGHSALGKRAVRAAIMYALDHEAIATNIHKQATPPVTTPGGDCWDATEFVSQKWIDENLITYSRDRNRASRLMREAGFSKDGRQWVGDAGQPLTLTLPTPNSTPRWEPTVARQLSEFGIQTSVRTLDSTVYSARVDTGEFSIWPSTRKYATNLAPYTLVIWRNAASSPTKFGIYPEEQFESGSFLRNGAPFPRTEDRYRVFTIEAPPVGKPNQSVREYHPAALALFFWTNPPEAEFRRRVKKGMWLANWYLPTIPLTKRLEQYFIDDANWSWPTDSTWWKSFIRGSAVLSGSLFSKGKIRAKTDIPETVS